MSASRWTVYCHIHRESGRRYVGVTKKTWRQRWNQHVYTSSRLAKKGWSHFANAIRKYGPEAFDHEVLEVCSSLEEANDRERYWIGLYDTRNPVRGFNIKKGGDHTPHPIKNPWNRPEYRAKCLPVSKTNVKKATAAASSQKIQSRPEVRQNLSVIMKEIANTPEGRAQRLSAAKPGKILSPEHRAKISANTKSRDPEVRAKMSSGVRKALQDPEVRARIAAAIREGMASPEVREKISKSSRDRERIPPSPETRDKISESLKRRPKRTHCQRGHSMDDAIIESDGRRRCRQCKRLRDSVQWKRNQENPA